MLIERIGVPAMLEQTAEECAELAQACLKYARHLRNENPAFKDEKELWANLHEEIADVDICLNELSQDGVIKSSTVRTWIEEKQERMRHRLKGDGHDG